MTIDRLFLPIPRRVENRAGCFPLPAEAFIVLLGDPLVLLPAGRRFQAALEKQFGLHWQLSASPCVPVLARGLELRIANEVPHPQGYRLDISGQGLSITAADGAGAFYGVCTLIQWLSQQPGPQVENLFVEDWPDYPARGVMLDISRDRVPTLETLYELVDRLAGWKVNQLQLYMEHTFAYQAHPEVWREASPMTAEEILDLDAYCRERFIELVPNQNSFGHMERWLKHPRYAALAEIQGEFSTPWGKLHGPFSLAPADPGSFELVSGLYEELLPHFTSRMVNVGCDETFDLGQGRSRELCAQSGVGRVYLEYLNRILAEIQHRGRLPQFWGDIIIKHPDLVPELPKDAIALEWGYESTHPFDEHGAQFESAGVPFYVCPGTSSWNSLAGRTDNALGNLVNAAENGLKHGASGYLNTDWGDNGHWQVPSVSWLGLAAGAAFGWCLKSNVDLAAPQVVSRFAFDDPSGSTNRLYRSRRDRLVAGVCGGLGQYFNVDPVLVRIAFVVLTLATGVFLLVYLVLAILTPERPQGEPEPLAIPTAIAPRGREVLAYILVGLGLLILASNLGLFRIALWGWIWPLIIIAIGVLLLLRSRPAQS